jgi:hypothetical protein
VRWARLGLVATGVLAMVWGAWLLWPQLTAGTPEAVSVVVWIFAWPVLHDALLAPAVAALAIALAAAAPPRWRTPVGAGLVISGVLVLVALPALLRPSAGPPNPGLGDRDYSLGLAAALGLVWLLVLAAGLRGRRRPGAD